MVNRKRGNGTNGTTQHEENCHQSVEEFCSMVQSYMGIKEVMYDCMTDAMENLQQALCQLEKMEQLREQLSEIGVTMDGWLENYNNSSRYARCARLRKELNSTKEEAEALVEEGTIHVKKANGVLEQAKTLEHRVANLQSEVSRRCYPRCK